MRNLAIPVVLLCVSGCSTPEEFVTVFQPDQEPIVHELPRDGCYEVNATACIDPVKTCGAYASMHVYIGTDGTLQEQICLPPQAELNQSLELSGGSEAPEIEDHDNVKVLGDAERPALEGDLEISAGYVLLAGDEPETAVIDGELRVSGYKDVVIGVTVTGDLDVETAENAFSNCVVEGRVTLMGDDTQLAGCEFFGDVRLTGIRSRLTQNIFHGKVFFLGNKYECAENWTVNDEGELEPLDCSN